MALSPSNFLIPLALLALFARGALAATVIYDFNISWVSIPPFLGNEYGRAVIGVNGQWPIPPLHVTKGDNVIINAFNGLGNETTTLHMHGVFMNGTTEMDGAPQTSQCAIPPGNTFTYNFTVRFSCALPSIPKLTQSTDQPARHLLVSFSYQGPVPGRASRTADRA